VAYLRGSLQAGAYYPITPDYVVSLTGQGGHILGIEQDVRIEDRFFVGGDNLRGFQTGGIGPRDSIYDDALGGETYYAGSVSLGYPLGLPPELGISGRVWSDFGSLFGIHPTGPTVENSSSIRVSTGTGISWKSPLGPIKVDLGFPIIKEPFDRTQLFHVSFGTRF
jgi:outer membrane protein insertion porin family